MILPATPSPSVAALWLEGYKYLLSFFIVVSAGDAVTRRFIYLHGTGREGRGEKGRGTGEGVLGQIEQTGRVGHRLSCSGPLRRRRREGVGGEHAEACFAVLFKTSFFMWTCWLR